MENLWSDVAAVQSVERCRRDGVNEDLALRTYSSRLLGSEPRLVLHGGGNTSVKTTGTDVLGNEVDVICVKGSGYDLATIAPHGHVALRRRPLDALRDATLSDEAMLNYFRQNMLDTAAPNPSIETLTHAYLPHKFVDHSHAVTATAIAAQTDSQRACRAIFGRRVAWVPYVKPGFDLAKATTAAFEAHPDAEGLLLANHGIFTFGATAKESYERMIEFISIGEAFVAVRASEKRTFAGIGLPHVPAPVASLLPILRGAFARAAKDSAPRRWLFDVRRTARTTAFAGGRDLADYAMRGVATPEHVIRMKSMPLVLPAPVAHDLDLWTVALDQRLDEYVEAYDAYFARQNARVHNAKHRLDPLPRVAVIPGHGVIGIGKSAAEAAISADVAEAWVDAILDGEALGRFESLTEEQLFDMEYWSLEQVKLGKGRESAFARHVVVVTGGAGAIGSATARAFSALGAEIALLDLDGRRASEAAAAIGPRAIGIGVDVTDAASVSAGIAKVVERFGGVDILVSNAGSANAGSLLALEDATLHASFDINFFGHHYVAREMTRVMRVQGIGGVLLFNVSKQAVNPGPDFGAYGTAKAALLALVRQYALEHGADGIRVNAVNADRIRSGLLTAAMIAKRSHARGLTEEQYMSGNLLHTEVTAGDVAAAFVATAGLDKTTGNVTTVDGGNVAAMLR